VGDEFTTRCLSGCALNFEEQGDTRARARMAKNSALFEFDGGPWDLTA